MKWMSAAVFQWSWIYKCRSWPDLTHRPSFGNSVLPCLFFNYSVPPGFILSLLFSKNFGVFGLWFHLFHSLISGCFGVSNSNLVLNVFVWFCHLPSLLFVYSFSIVLSTWPRFPLVLKVFFPSGPLSWLGDMTSVCLSGEGILKGSLCGLLTGWRPAQLP